MEHSNPSLEKAKNLEMGRKGKEGWMMSHKREGWVGGGGRLDLNCKDSHFVCLGSTSNLCIFPAGVESWLSLGLG